MIDVRAILDLHETAVAEWHKREIDNPYEGFLHVVCLQHEQNFRLWHEEDIARSPDVTDADMARVKRAIDKLNQRRNDLIEQLDDCLLAELSDTGVPAWSGARLNTETPGSAIDRLSILALRLYHMEEQAARTDADAAHVAKVKARLVVLRATASRSVGVARRVAGRHFRRPETPEGLPPVQDVQRPDAESVSLRGEAAGGVKKCRESVVGRDQHFLFVVAVRLGPWSTVCSSAWTTAGW